MGVAEAADRFAAVVFFDLLEGEVEVLEAGCGRLVSGCGVVGFSHKREEDYALRPDRVKQNSMPPQQNLAPPARDC